MHGNRTGYYQQEGGDKIMYILTLNRYADSNPWGAARISRPRLNDTGNLRNGGNDTNVGNLRNVIPNISTRVCVGRRPTQTLAEQLDFRARVSGLKF